MWLIIIVTMIVALVLIWVFESFIGRGGRKV